RMTPTHPRDVRRSFMFGHVRRFAGQGRALGTFTAALAIMAIGLPAASAQQSNDIVVPSGYQVREFASGLGAAIASSVTPGGDIFVLASGFGGFAADAKPGPVQIFKISASGQVTKWYDATATPGLK